MKRGPCAGSTVSSSLAHRLPVALQSWQRIATTLINIDVQLREAGENVAEQLSLRRRLTENVLGSGKTLTELAKELSTEIENLLPILLQQLNENQKSLAKLGDSM